MSRNVVNPTHFVHHLKTRCTLINSKYLLIINENNIAPKETILSKKK